MVRRPFLCLDCGVGLPKAQMSYAHAGLHRAMPGERVRLHRRATERSAEGEEIRQSAATRLVNGLRRLMRAAHIGKRGVERIAIIRSPARPRK